MYVSASQTQAESVSKMCQQQVKGYEQIGVAIMGFVEMSPFLRGKTYDSAKLYFSSVILPLNKGATLLSEAVEAAVKKFPEEYISQVDKGDLKQSELERKIQEIDRLLYQAEEIKNQILTYNNSKNDNPFQLRTTNLFISLYQDTRENLEKQLAKLLDFHANSPSIFSELEALKNAVDQGLNQTKTAFDASSGTFKIPTDLSWAEKINISYYMKLAKGKYNDYLKEHPEDLQKVLAIIKYEYLHPEYTETTDEFLSPLELFDQIQIKYMIYTAPSPYDTLCLEYMDKFRISSINQSGVFDSGDNTLVFNVLEDRNDPRGKYYTFFHEMGHAIDFYYAEDKRGSFFGLFSDAFFSDGFKYEDKTLSEWNISDVKNNIQQSIESLLSEKEYSHLSEKEKKKIIDNVTNSILSRDTNYDKLPATELKIMNSLKNDYNVKLSGADNEPASDIYGGVTNFTLEGQPGYGHDADYWYFWVVRIRETNKESFAEYFGRQMTTEPEHSAGLESIEKYLPDSKNHMDEMIKEMGKDIR